MDEIRGLPRTGIFLMYLLDTNICIYAIRKRSDKVINKIKKNINNGMYVSSLTIAEMEAGIEGSLYPNKNRQALIEFLSVFTVLNFTDKDAIAYGKWKAILKKAGRQIGPIDLLLAGQALSNNLILVTNNTREFCRVEDLLLEDWTC